MNQTIPKVIILIGATAAGKAKTAAALSRLTGYRLVSLDSMKVFIDMHIGTAGPRNAEIDGVPIALTGIVKPTESFSVGQYLDRAAEFVQEIRRGKQPGIIFVGGTALYVRMMVRGAFEGPPADQELRAQLKQIAAGQGTATLHDQLVEVDPEAAGRIHPHDLKRIVRALEVYRLTGKPISEHHKENKSILDGLDYSLVIINRARETLYDRINKRVDRMMAEGFLDEVRMLYDKYKQLGPQARHALGYEELAEHLQGKCTLQEAVELTKQHTRNFAKQQLTWFRGMIEADWVDIAPEDTPQTLAGKIMEKLTTGQGTATFQKQPFKHNR